MAPDPDAGTTTPPFSLAVLAGRADMVTAGDALVALTGDDLDDVALTVDGAEVELHDDGAGRRVARVEGLAIGAHEVVALRADERAALQITNTDVAGPVFSGPHELPFYCGTDAALLGAPLDDDCAAATTFVYFSMTPAGTLQPLADPAAPPDDVVQTTTTDGVQTSFIVQVEVGTINRAIYWIATLYDGAPWEPWSPSPVWNGKLLYFFGGGCGTGYVQGDPSYGLINDAAGAIALGHAAAHASLNTLGNNCNDVTSAETAMMVKEHFIERYGVPRYTMGWGGSGGSIQQHLIGENYPGILDGIVPTISFPDVWSILPDIVDCRLLLNAFEAAPTLWTDDEAKRAATGYGSLQTCVNWNAGFGSLLVPDTGCAAGIPAEAIYDAATNPSRVRCTLQDHNVNIFGTDRTTGYARRAYDNVGVQYGLVALQTGAITTQMFLDLNARIGGFDDDGAIVAERTAATDEAIRLAYSTGRITTGGQGLATIPIIDVRPWLDETGDIHDSFRTDSTRARLVAANGDAANHVAFIAGAGAPAGQANLDAFIAMDQWLTALADDDDTNRRAAMTRTKPDRLVDRCYVTTTPANERCDATFRRYSSPRRTAGAPLANDVIQCALRPIDPDEYGVELTPSELDDLASIFPAGVCDWDAPPPNRVEHAGTWQRY